MSKYKLDTTMYKNPDDSFHFGGVDIQPGETYLDAVCRTVPARERAMSGLALKLVSLRLRAEQDNISNEEEQAKVKAEFDRLNNMTDEEYDKENCNE